MSCDKEVFDACIATVTNDNLNRFTHSAIQCIVGLCNNRDDVIIILNIKYLDNDNEASMNRISSFTSGKFSKP